MRSTFAALFTASALSLALAACGGNKNEKVDYKTPGIDLRSKSSPLEVPPDLVSPSRDDRYAVPDSAGTGSATLSTYSAARQPAPAGAVTPFAQPASAAAPAAGVPKFRLERDGTTRWLVTTVAPNQLWPQLRDFWKDLGFVLVKDDQTTGIMETDWVENRARIAGDPIQNALSKVLGSFVSNGERDRYRTRIEPSLSTPGAVEVYVSHRGAEELRNRDRDGTYWELRPSNPELEAEMLQRIMVRLGADQTVAKQMTDDAKAAPQTSRATLNTAADGSQQLVVREGMESAWRRVGVALDRTGVVVEDRDRARGVYFVRYVASEDLDGAQEQGWFSRFFGRKKPAAGTGQFRVSVVGNDVQTTVRLLANEGDKPATPEATRQILNLLQRELR
ncbi:MAG: outer membrane protein assembly factor BamC [Candidatus Dactylopiibacterium sp.]|nr:outer membrane protein assembly factor BamC [Candidatus Dactylopiibacterium sp.]